MSLTRGIVVFGVFARFLAVEKLFIAQVQGHNEIDIENHQYQSRYAQYYYRQFFGKRYTRKQTHILLPRYLHDAKNSLYIALIQRS